MKKFIKTVTVILLSVLFTVPTMARTKNDRISENTIPIAGNMYAICATVTDINYNYNTITFTDFDGEMWAAYDTETWKYTNDRIYCLLFNNNGTETLYDDEIIKILIVI